MKKKILLLVLCLCLLLPFAAACDDTTESPVAATFSGQALVKGSNYKFNLRAREDKTFSLSSAQTQDTNVKGTYTVSTSRGYEFTFSDAANTKVRAGYDAAKKEHSFNYEVTIGGAKYPVTLTFSDDAFVPAADYVHPIEDGNLYVFKGATSGRTPENVTVRLKDKGNFLFTSSALTVDTKGTYTFDSANHKFTLTFADGKVVESKYSAAKNGYQVIYATGSGFTAVTSTVYYAVDGTTQLVAGDFT